jgi:hypothetical protein
LAAAEVAAAAIQQRVEVAAEGIPVAAAVGGIPVAAVGIPVEAGVAHHMPRPARRLTLRLVEEQQPMFREGEVADTHRRSVALRPSVIRMSRRDPQAGARQTSALILLRASIRQPVSMQARQRESMRAQQQVSMQDRRPVGDRRVALRAPPARRSVGHRRAARSPARGGTSTAAIARELPAGPTPATR